MYIAPAPYLVARALSFVQPSFSISFLVVEDEIS